MEPARKKFKRGDLMQSAIELKAQIDAVQTPCGWLANKRMYAAGSDWPYDEKWQDADFLVKELCDTLSLQDKPWWVGTLEEDEEEKDELYVTLFLDGKTYRATRTNASKAGEFWQMVYETHAEPSSFGDMTKLQTARDDCVRRSREIPCGEKWSCSPDLLDRIATVWQLKKGCRDQVRVEPYKLLMYGEGDHFASHRDTPATNMIGSFVLGIFDSSTKGGLVLDDDQASKEKADFGQFWAFSPDTVHEVQPVAGGLRVALAFKIYLEEEERGGGGGEVVQVSPLCEAETHEVCEKAAHLIARILALHKEEEEERVGFLCLHSYSKRTEWLDTTDRRLLNALSHIAAVKTIEDIPVKIEMETFKYEDEEADIKVNVFSLEDEKREQEEKNIPFYALHHQRQGFKWFATSSKGGFVGNSAEPSEEACIYLHRSFVVSLLKN